MKIRASLLLTPFARSIFLLPTFHNVQIYIIMAVVPAGPTEKDNTMNHDPPTDQMLTVKDVADCLSISVRSVWRWTKSGKIPAPIKLGFHVVRWRASEIQRHIDEQPAMVRAG